MEGNKKMRQIQIKQEMNSINYNVCNACLLFMAYSSNAFCCFSFFSLFLFVCWFTFSPPRSTPFRIANEIYRLLFSIIFKYSICLSPDPPTSIHWSIGFKCILLIKWLNFNFDVTIPSLLLTNGWKTCAYRSHFYFYAWNSFFLFRILVFSFYSFLVYCDWQSLSVKWTQNYSINYYNKDFHANNVYI